MALPWWQRRCYLEGLRDEADQRTQAASPTTRQTGASGLDAIYGGTLGDIAATTGFTTG